ncbi:MAG: hypothetical protein ACFFDK_04910 [Promethearchaeota archaeon]
MSSNATHSFNTVTFQEELNISDIYYKNLGGVAQNTYVSGDYVYIADFNYGLMIVDISDPTHPGAIWCTLCGYITGVCVCGDYAYVSDYYKQLIIIDISDPTLPIEVSNVPLTDQAWDVFIAGDYAYVANYGSGLAIIDISDPRHPGTPIYLNTAGLSYDVYIEGDYAYVADRSAGLAVIDISDPTHPGEPIYVALNDAQGVFISGDYAYVADSLRGLAVIDISDPTNPGSPIHEYTNCYTYDIFISGDYAYLTCYYSGLAIIDISNPLNPGPAIYVDEIEKAFGVFVSGNFAYVANGDVSNKQLAIIKIGEIITPYHVVYEDTNNFASRVFVAGDYAYVADYIGLAVIDISNPSNPGPPIYTIPSIETMGVYVSGDYAYVAVRQSGLAVIDISDPTHPGPTYYADTPGDAYGVFISGDYAYVADRTNGLAVVNISDPTHPYTVVSVDTTGQAIGIWVEGDYAYIADGPEGIAVIDISDPIHPGTPTYEYSNYYDYASDIYISGDNAYVADGDYGLAILFIYDPPHTLIPQHVDTDDYANGVFVSGDYAYVADTKSGLAVIDVSDPNNPGAPVYEESLFEAKDVYISGDYAYIADDVRGLAVIKIMIPWYALEAPELNSILPNPDYDGIIDLDWNDVVGAINYDIYRATAPITTMTGKTPIATVGANSHYQDIISVDANYYYVIVSSNGRGKSWISNCQSVNVIIDFAAPNGFSIYSPTDWVSDLTPMVIGSFYTAKSGVNVSTVEYAYSTMGEAEPNNWIAVDGVYKDGICTNPAENGDTGWIYAQVLNVPFNQESESLNTIRFRATDLANNQGYQSTATNIKIDNESLFWIETPLDWINDINPTVISKFYMGGNGVNITEVKYAYSTMGEAEPTNWVSVDGVYEDGACTDPAEHGDTGWIYARVLDVPFNQESETLNTVRFQTVNTVGKLGTQLVANVIKVDNTIDAPIELNVQPNGWTTVNLFNLTWVNPIDLSGIAGVHYKLDSPPVSDTDGIYIAGADITQITGIKVSGGGNHTLYIWLKDNAENINFTKYVCCYLCLKIPTGSSGGGGGGGGGGKAKKAEEPAIPIIALIAIGVVSAIGAGAVTIFILRKRILPKREIQNTT